MDFSTGYFLFYDYLEQWQAGRRRATVPGMSFTPVPLHLVVPYSRVMGLLETPMPRVPTFNEIGVSGSGTQASVHFKAPQMILLGARFGSTRLIRLWTFS